MVPERTAFQITKIKYIHHPPNISKISVKKDFYYLDKKNTVQFYGIEIQDRPSSILP
jgi:hypothetical protein